MTFKRVLVQCLGFGMGFYLAYSKVLSGGHVTTVVMCPAPVPPPSPAPIGETPSAPPDQAPPTPTTPDQSTQQPVPAEPTQPAPAPPAEPAAPPTVKPAFRPAVTALVDEVESVSLPELHRRLTSGAK
jgi:hypothetical protein